VVYSSSALELFWQRIDGAVSYRIERDGQLLDERDGLSFFDTGLADATTFVYRVIAVSADDRLLTSETIEVTTQTDPY